MLGISDMVLDSVLNLHVFRLAKKALGDIRDQKGIASKAL